MKYYVAQDAADVADELWANYAPAADEKLKNGKTCGKDAQIRAAESQPANAVSP